VRTSNQYVLSTTEQLNYFCI